MCLFTEARYTRHLSQADLHAAFQDHPLSLDHFPPLLFTGITGGSVGVIERFKQRASRQAVVPAL